MKEVKEAQESEAKKYQTSKAWIIRAGQKRRCAITGITTPGSALIAIHSTSLPPATYSAAFTGADTWCSHKCVWYRQCIGTKCM